MLGRLHVRGLLVLVLVALLVPATVQAKDPPQPTPIPPAGLNPGPVPNTRLVSPRRAFSAPLTAEEQEGAAVTQSLTQTPTGPVPEPISSAGGLFADSAACLTFDDPQLWAGRTWSRQYAGWGMQGLTERPLYYAQNLTFDDETAIASVRSLKIAGDKPFRGLVVSPTFKVPAGAEVVVRASYYIRLSANQYPRDDESIWAALNVNAVEGSAVEDNGPTNGYLRNDAWHRFESRLTMGPDDGAINVVLLGNNVFTNASVAVYFDNVEIWVNGKPLAQCLYPG
jgi:hypothetical protein